METCGSCRFWDRRLDRVESGNCRRRPPVILECVAAANISAEGDLDSADLELATRYPITFIDDWCGDHDISSEAVRRQQDAAGALHAEQDLDRRYVAALVPPPPADDDPF